MGSAKKRGALNGDSSEGNLLTYRGFLDHAKAKVGDCGGAADRAPLPNPRPAGFTDPVRDLKEAAARDIAKHYWNLGVIRFPRQDVKGFVFPALNLPQRAKDGTFSWNGQLLLSNVVGSVRYINVNNTKADVLFGLGWRMLVLAIRMAEFVQTEFGGPASIFHMGFAGNGTIDTNRHNRGVALDFAGASASFGTLMVRQNWGDQPIPDSLGGVQGKWPTGFTFRDPRYRLDAQTDRMAHDFFLKMYNFAIRECNDGSTKSPSRSGLFHLPGWNGAVVHPDYGKEGTSDGRKLHIDHIHMDVNDEFIGPVSP